MEGRKFSNAVVIFGGLTIAGIIMAVVGLGLSDAGVKDILISFGAALFGGALAFFLIAWYWRK